MTRIWHQSANELEHLTVYKQALEAQAASILPDDVQVEVHGVATGTWRR